MPLSCKKMSIQVFKQPLFADMTEQIMMKMSACYDEMGFMPSHCKPVDLTGLEGTNCYCDPEAAAELRRVTGSLPLNALHWIDTGDYHYITLFWLERIDRPFALLHLDHHPDDQECAFGGDVLSCGGWVREARERLPMMKCCITVRSSSDSVVIPEGLPVYVSLDKDVMSREYARTDWDQGEMSLSGVMEVISTALAGHELIGADICGEITSDKGACGEDVDINLMTDKVLSDFFVSLQS